MFKVISTLIFIATYAFGVQFDITNKDGGEIWVDIQGNDNKPPLENGGFKLASDQTVK